MDITGYKKTVLANTDRVRIILMLYEGTLNHMKIAKQKIERGDTLSKGIHISKATLIVTELSNVLDMEKGGEISVNLRRLYTYVLQRLLYANLNNDVAALEEAEKIIGTIKDGWKEMIKGLKQQEVAVGV
ncbi:MAG: flagellar export chaperone FliS [Nitrospirae bacterium]|nr:flagellar export chaperone FliS [Nitrospirota bacterium]